MTDVAQFINANAMLQPVVQYRQLIVPSIKLRYSTVSNLPKYFSISPTMPPIFTVPMERIQG